MKLSEEEYLAHYGILRRSGRYPWGSGGPEHAGHDQPTRNKSFLDHVENLRRQGMSETAIAEGMGISTTQLRAAKSIAKNQQKMAEIGMAQRLKDKGYSNVAIGERMGKNESYIRTLLAPGAQDKADILTSTSDMLRKQVEEKKYVDVGTGVENYIGVSKERLNTAVAMLQEEGYTVHSVKTRQIGTGLDTEVKVLAPPGTEWKEVQQNKDKIQHPFARSDDHGRTFDDDGKFLEPLSIHPDRVDVRYKEDGGAKADGVIYVRPGVKDVSLGQARYAQVRVKVGNDHYLKGMAMYHDNLPPGTDLLFNTNKSNTGNKLDALKELKADPDLPFGAVVRQLKERDEHGVKQVSSAMNIVNEEGNWGDWSKSLSSQMLSKQPRSLAKEQLDLTYERRKQEFDDIRSLTNPTIKKKLLESFADGTDSAAVHLKAAALPRQASHVILPIETMPPGQVYAPNYRNGERVVLIRYPHGGTFEIPELVVNNKHAEAKKVLGDARDAIGIHHSVAERLSGADFDGDTVLVIPNNSNKVKHSPALEALKNFDPQKYKLPDDSPIPKITPRRKQQEMGDVSNLITDMTIRGAPHEEIARAVKHSMVVIDAEKHNLNYRQSALDNGIRDLKAEYQGRANAGASTLISRARAQTRVVDRKLRPQGMGGPVDPHTGEKIFVPTGKKVLNNKGELVDKLVRSKQLAETNDAHTLSSGTLIEKAYADHSNKLKSLANQARLAALNTPPLNYSPSAKRAYSKEVDSLNSKLTLALKNAPLERQAQLLANAVVRAKRDANPDLDAESLKKIKFAALAEARIRTGAGKQRITIDDKEWNAIQAGAISNSKLSQILNNADLDRVRELATPRTQRVMTTTATNRAKRMLADGYTRAEVADQLGVSTSTLDAAVKEVS